jgi:hypothetical protein
LQLELHSGLGGSIAKGLFRERRESVPGGWRKNILFLSLAEKPFCNRAAPLRFGCWSLGGYELSGV